LTQEATTAPGDITGFVLSVPDSWFEVDLHPDTRNASIQTLVNERLSEIPELFEHRATIARALRSAARSAFAAGAVYCGTMVQGLDSMVITATVTVTMVEAPDDKNGVEAIAQQLTTVARSGPDQTWRDVVYAELPEVGRVPRTQGVEDVTMPEGSGWIRTVLMQTFVPLPGPRSTRVAVITCSSPILPLVDELLDLFDAVTSTFRFTTVPG
jgi:hypothetical protein